MITAAWVVLILLAFGLGVLTGLYVSSHSMGTAKHRQPISPRPMLMPPTLSKEQAESTTGLLQSEDAPRIKRIRDYVDNNSTAEDMENGHWEGLSGSLETEQEPKVLRPEETSSSLLGLSQGEIRPTGGLKPVFGETEHLEYDPEDYEEPLICQPCKRALIKGETFWAVSLPEEGEGVFIPICDDCEAKSHG